MYTRLSLGDKTVELNEEKHKAVMSAILNILSSAICNGDSAKSGDIVSQFLAGVNPLMRIEAGDDAKQLVANTGLAFQLAELYKRSGEVSIIWTGNRGGHRGANKTAENITAESLFADPTTEAAQS